ncbi:MAG: ABC transporter substrate-binding protein [Thermodesulfobacteriota bacterium]
MGAVLALVLMVCPLLAAAVPCRAQEGEPPRPARVFVVHSYNPEYVWVRNINQGILEALSGSVAAYEFFYMDAKRRPGKHNLELAARGALARIESFDPDVVIAADDPAQAYLTVPYLKGKARPQVIFCGVNAPPSLYGFPASNVSGVRERWHYREGFGLLKRLFPHAKSAVFMVEASESGRYVADDLKEDLEKGGPFELEVAGIEIVSTFDDWKRLVEHYRGRTDAFALGLYQSIRDADAGVASPEKVIAWTFSATDKPTLGFSDVSIEHGILCGVLESAHEQGFLAGSMARQALPGGVPAGQLPMRLNDRGVIMVNLNTAERLGVDIPYELIEASGVVVTRDGPLARH